MFFKNGGNTRGGIDGKDDRNLAAIVTRARPTQHRMIMTRGEPKGLLMNDGFRLVIPAFVRMRRRFVYFRTIAKESIVWK